MPRAERAEAPTDAFPLGDVDHGLGASIPAATGFDPASVRPLLDDPRLAKVADVASQPQRAAAEMRVVLDGHSDLSDDERSLWLYQLGRFRQEAGAPGAAVQAFDQAAETGGVLAPHAQFAAGELSLEMGRHADAVERLSSVPAELGVPRRRLLARALKKNGDLDRAFDVWRELVARDPKPAAWTTTALELAKALLTKPGPEYAAEAARVARRVRHESRRGAGAGEALELEKRALALLPHDQRKAIEEPGIDQRAREAEALVAALQSKRAVSVTDRLVKLPEAQKPGEVACRLHRARGKALGNVRRKAESSEAYGVAIERCEGLPERAPALYSGGRMAHRAGRPELALERYAMLEREFPEHRLSDDARLLAAAAARDLGNPQRAAEMLLGMPEAYPEGDMVGDGLFQLALIRMSAGDWEGALEPLRRGHAHQPRERAYFRAGRFPYFIGRALIELGQRDEGIASLSSLVSDQPLTYYAALAFSRLEAESPGSGEAIVRERMRGEDKGSFVIPMHEVFDHDAFRRAVALARLGEWRWCKGELDELGLSSRTAPRELLFAAAFILDRAGGTEASHAIFRASTMEPRRDRTEIVGWLDHYPAGTWRATWELAFPRPYAELVAKETARSGVPEPLVYAIMREESAFSPRVVSSANAYGLMQLILPTAKSMAKPLGLTATARTLKEPDVNIALGTRFLSVLRKRFVDNPLLAIPGYNAGPGAPERWLRERPDEPFDLWVEHMPYRETRRYTKRVMTSMAAYEILYGSATSREAFAAPTAARSSP